MHHVPFEDQGDPIEKDLRDQIGRLTTEKHQLEAIVAQLRAENRDLRAERDRAHRELAHAHRDLARRWWQR